MSISLLRCKGNSNNELLMFGIQSSGQIRVTTQAEIWNFLKAHNSPMILTVQKSIYTVNKTFNWLHCTLLVSRKKISHLYKCIRSYCDDCTRRDACRRGCYWGEELLYNTQCNNADTYMHMVTNMGHLLLCWVSWRRPFITCAHHIHHSRHMPIRCPLITYTHIRAFHRFCEPCVSILSANICFYCISLYK